MSLYVSGLKLLTTTISFFFLFKQLQRKKQHFTGCHKNIKCNILLFFWERFGTLSKVFINLKAGRFQWFSQFIVVGFASGSLFLGLSCYKSLSFLFHAINSLSTDVLLSFLPLRRVLVFSHCHRTKNQDSVGLHYTEYWCDLQKLIKSFLNFAKAIGPKVGIQWVSMRILATYPGKARPSRSS